MADSKLSALTESTDPQAEDELYTRDISEGTAADQSKMVTLDTLLASVLCYEGAVLTYDNEILVW